MEAGALSPWRNAAATGTRSNIVRQCCLARAVFWNVKERVIFLLTMTRCATACRVFYFGRESPFAAVIIW